LIRRVLIANRGEIAARIARTCARLGIETVLAASEADRDSLPARLATRAVCIGPAHAAASYLKPELLVQAALSTGCDAVHPGYGFLSERAAFARLCEQHGLIFIGPTPAQLEATGDKLRAREQAEKSDVPVVPGGPAASRADAHAQARRIGFPILIKAVGGGGGRGMRLVEHWADFDSALELAAAEAGAAFSDARVYLERFVARARHVEVQILGDGTGRVMQLGERDCSVQRRYQKLVEESPSPVLRPDVRRELCESAVRLIKAAGYTNAGTVEFLVDKKQNFYLLEVNARIQVEHPVTEQVTGIDLIKEQIRIAAGHPLSFKQKDVPQIGHAIECRINAEDPARNFAPSPGTILEWRPPGGPGVRLDSHAYAGYRIPPNYDSMIGKLIVHRPTRAEAIACMKRALGEFHVAPIKTTIPLHLQIMDNHEFQKGDVDTGFVERVLLNR